MKHLFPKFAPGSLHLLSCERLAAEQKADDQISQPFGFGLHLLRRFSANGLRLYPRSRIPSCRSTGLSRSFVWKSYFCFNNRSFQKSCTSLSISVITPWNDNIWYVFLPRCSIQMRDTPLYRCFLAETIIAWTKVGLVVFTFSVSMNHLALCVDESPRTLKSTGCVLSSHAGVLLALGGVFRFTTLQNTPDVKRTAICLVDAAICHYVSQNRDVYIGKHSQT